MAESLGKRLMRLRKENGMTQNLVGKSEYKTVQEAFNAIQRANAAKAESETMNDR